MILREIDIDAALSVRAARERDLRDPLARRRACLLNPYVHAAAATDPNFADVELLLHFDGPDGSTTFTDSSVNNRTVTRHGVPTIITAVSKFGGASGNFPGGTGDYLSVSIGAFNPRTDAFCFEGWIRRVGADVYFVSGGANGDDFYCLLVGGTLYLGDGVTNTIAAAGAISNSQFDHVAFTFDATTYRVFVGGALIASSTTLLKNISITDLEIGARTGEGWYTQSRFDDLRITVGSARYTAAFTPPTEAFPNS